MSSDADLPLIPSDGYVRISDGGVLVVEDFYEDGTFKANGITRNQMTRQKFKKRGKGYALRQVEDQDVGWSLELHLCGFSGGTNGTVLDAFRGKNGWSAAVSTSATFGDVPTLKVEFFARTSDLGAADDAVLTMKYCAADIEVTEGVPGKLGLSGEAYVFGADPDSITIA